MWIATADGKIVGTLSLGRNRLRRFFVHPNYQRKGIGKMLLKELITCAKKSGLKSVWAGSDLGAIEAYKKMGFKAGKKFFNTEINQEEIKMTLEL